LRGLPFGILGTTLGTILFVFNNFFETVEAHAGTNFKHTNSYKNEHSEKIVYSEKRKGYCKNKNVGYAEEELKCDTNRISEKHILQFSLNKVLCEI
jgi:hypothetical protein